MPLWVLGVFVAWIELGTLCAGALLGMALLLKSIAMKKNHTIGRSFATVCVPRRKVKRQNA
jgi:hypothetical protein